MNSQQFRGERRLLSDATTLRWTPGIGIYQRSPTTISFGADTHTAPVIEIDDAARVLRVLRRFHQATARAQIIAQLAAVGGASAESAGMGQHAARSLVDELISAGLLNPCTRSEPEPIPLIILGTGDLAEAITQLAQRAQFTVYRPHPGMYVPQFLAELPAEIFVIAADMMGESGPLARWLLPRHSSCLPVSLLDNSGLIGPLRHNGVGPCLLCFALTQADAEPHWHNVISHTSRPYARQITRDAALVTATAARTIALLRLLHGHKPPLQPRVIGAEQTRSIAQTPMPGITFTIDPYAFDAAPNSRFVEPHPRCPHCFESSSPEQPLLRTGKDELSDSELDKRKRSVREASYRFARTISSLSE